jgi:hypothetical protein
MKPLSQMSDAEKSALLNRVEPDQPEPPQELVDLMEEIDQEVQSGQPMYQSSTKDRQHFLSSLDKKPKKGILGMFSKDDPQDLSKYPKPPKAKPEQMRGKVEPVYHEPNYDVNQPGGILKPQRKRFELGGAGEYIKAIMWVFHIFLLIGTLYFTYYMVTLMKSPGVVDISGLASLCLIVSVQVSLVALNGVIGSVLKA